jgi:hypothetical protein
LIARDRIACNMPIGDVLVAGVAELDHVIVDEAGESGVADERHQEFSRAAGAVARLAERHQRKPIERVNEIVCRRRR